MRMGFLLRVLWFAMRCSDLHVFNRCFLLWFAVICRLQISCKSQPPICKSEALKKSFDLQIGGSDLQLICSLQITANQNLPIFKKHCKTRFLKIILNLWIFISMSLKWLWMRLPSDTCWKTSLATYIKTEGQQCYSVFEELHQLRFSSTWHGYICF